MADSTGPLSARRLCPHMSTLVEVRMPSERTCSECVKIGSSWVHLRICQTCSATLCCDSIPNEHASKHARAEGHPLIASAEPSERWLYCYEHDCMAPY